METPHHDALLARLRELQRDEITEHHIYRRLAETVPTPENRRVLETLAADELRHYGVWRSHTGRDEAPDAFRVARYALLARIFGFTFAVKLMEHRERQAQNDLGPLEAVFPEARTILQEEDRHEALLLGMLDEERLHYLGSMVLGVSDALVELTGTLAGLTLALQNTRLIALSGFITGVAAALSMGSSEYLSTKAEGPGKNPLKAALYTGGIYLVTVFLLLVPYFFLGDYFLCLGISLGSAGGIIGAFSFYTAIAQDQPFRKRFAEMAGLCLGVATFSFVLGYLARLGLGVTL